MKTTNIIYIPETEEFLIDGRTVKEDEFTIVEANILKEKAEVKNLLVGSVTDKDAHLLV